MSRISGNKVYTEIRYHQDHTIKNNDGLYDYECKNCHHLFDRKIEVELDNFNYCPICGAVILGKPSEKYEEKESRWITGAEVTSTAALLYAALAFALAIARLIKHL